MDISNKIIITPEQLAVITSDYSPDCFIVLPSTAQFQAAMSAALDYWEEQFWSIGIDKPSTEIRHIED